MAQPVRQSPQELMNSQEPFVIPAEARVRQCFTAAGLHHPATILSLRTSPPRVNLEGSVFHIDLSLLTLDVDAFYFMLKRDIGDALRQIDVKTYASNSRLLAVATSVASLAFALLGETQTACILFAISFAAQFLSWGSTHLANDHDDGGYAIQKATLDELQAGLEYFQAWKEVQESLAQNSPDRFASDRKLQDEQIAKIEQVLEKRGVAPTRDEERIKKLKGHIAAQYILSALDQLSKQANPNQQMVAEAKEKKQLLVNKINAAYGEGLFVDHLGLLNPNLQQQLLAEAVLKIEGGPASSSHPAPAVRAAADATGEGSTGLWPSLP